MAPIVVDPAKVREFRDAQALEAWYAEHHDSATELWIKLHKKGSGLQTVGNAECLDIALCWGWIDATRKSFDAQSYLQKYTPRSRTSTWSKINIGHVDRLRKAGRMQPSGEAEVQRAKADGRWDRAYGGFKGDDFPADLMEAISAEPAAMELFEQLSAQNRFALAFRVHNLKTETARKRKVTEFVEMLKRGETIYPNGKAR